MKAGLYIMAAIILLTLVGLSAYQAAELRKLHRQVLALSTKLDNLPQESEHDSLTVLKLNALQSDINDMEETISKVNKSVNGLKMKIDWIEADTSSIKLRLAFSR
ncbi:MAG: hypothetical protein ACYDCO_01965 [Armatimonadota bacterium]